MTAYLNAKQLRDRYGGITQRTLDRWRGYRGFPKPMQIGRINLWRIDELEAYEASERRYANG